MVMMYVKLLNLNLILYTFRATIVYTQYLKPTCCKTILFVNYTAPAYFGLSSWPSSGCSLVSSRPVPYASTCVAENLRV